MSDKDSRLPLSSKLLYGVGYIPDSLLNNTFFAMIMLAYKVEFGLAATLISLAMAVPRIYEAFADPFFGNLSDKTRSRWGRRRPFLAFGSVMGGICCVALWAPPAGLGQNALFSWLLIVALLYFTAYAIYTVPFMALGLGMTSDEKDRSSLMGFRVAANNLMLCTIVPMAPMCIYNGWLGSTPAESLRSIGLVLGGLVAGIGLFVAIFIDEGEPPAQEAGKPQKSHGLIDGIKTACSSRPFLMVTGIVSFTLISLGAVMSLSTFLGLSIIFPGGTGIEKKAVTQLSFVSGVVSNAAGMLFSPFVGKVCTRIGRKRLLTIALCNISLAFLLTPVLFSRQYPYLFLIFTTMVILSLSCVWVVTLGMLADVCDLDEIQNGERREGIFSSIFNWGIKVAMSVSSVMAGIAIDWSGFSAALTSQSEFTIGFLRWFFALGPIPFFAASIYLVCIFPLSPEKIKELRLEKEKNAIPQP